MSRKRKTNNELRDGVAPRATKESGPLIYPGMEDLGIGSVTYTDDFESDSFRDEEDDFEDINPDGLSDGYPDDYDPGIIPDDDGRKIPNGPFLFISCAFILIFLLLAGHLVWFNIREKDSVLNSPYNKRQSSLAERVIRGPIMSSDGYTLARTERDDEGNETRVYPYYNMFAHAVGFLTHGRSGLESAANYQLLTAHNNIIDQIINEFLKKKNPGDTVVTTIDRKSVV